MGVVGYYERVTDPLSSGGSIFKGMGESSSLLITDNSQAGRFLLDELRHFVETLRATSHKWDEEASAVERAHVPQITGRSPCLAVKAVFLDLDGVLYDTMPQYVKAWCEAFRTEAGFDLPEREVYLQEGRPGRYAVKEMAAKHGLKRMPQDRADAILVHRDRVLSQLGAAPIQHGAHELVEAVAKDGCPTWVVTGSSRPGISDAIANDFAPYLAAERLITGSSVVIGKPDPEPYLMAARKAGVLPSDVVVVENGPLGIQSASRAGMFCIGVNTGPLSEDDLVRAGARVVFGSCAELATAWPAILEELRLC